MKGIAVTAFALNLLAASTALFMASCAIHTPAPSPSKADALERVGHRRIAQVNFGDAAAYAVCTEPACPTVTPKTLASADVVRSPAALQRPAEIKVRQASAPASLDPGEEIVAPPTAPPRREHILVNFQTGSSVLTPQGQDRLKAALPFARHAERIVISGRTDSVGGDKLNETLAFARALAVRDYVREQLPSLDSIIAIDAKGRCCFLTDNETPTGRALNRRVEVVFQIRAGA